MLLKFGSAFKMEEDHVKKESKTALRSTRTASWRPRPGCKPTEYSYYLKSCHLCNKKLSLDKEVYMYRGDQGFCSVECRDRQIVLDEMRELETSTKKIVAPYRRCNNGGDRSETQILIEELRRRRRNNTPQCPKKIHWAITA